MSSLVIVKRGEKVPEKDRRPENPLLVKDMPALPESRRADQQGGQGSGVLFRCLPGRGRTCARIGDRAAAERQSGGADADAALAPADATGRVQQVGRLPIDGAAAGTYELRAIVKQGPEQIVRSTMLRVVE